MNIARSNLELRNEIVLDDYPVHMSGCCLFLQNKSAIDASTIVLEESADGVVYAPILFSTPAGGPFAAHTINPGGFASILFTAARPYVRIRLLALNEQGVICNLCTFADPMMAIA